MIYITGHKFNTAAVSKPQLALVRKANLPENAELELARVYTDPEYPGKVCYKFFTNAGKDHIVVFPDTKTADQTIAKLSGHTYIEDEDRRHTVDYDEKMELTKKPNSAPKRQRPIF